jgi:hypothetical protein
MAAVTKLANDVGTSAAYQALGMPRASYYRDRRKTSSPAVTASQPVPTRALHLAERETVLACLHEERFQDRSPAAVYATLLDAGSITARSASAPSVRSCVGASKNSYNQLCC